MGTVNGGISYWFTEDGLPAPREPLPGDTSADVAVVGGGYTGLWTAFAHAWSGVLGVPRDWCATVTLDRATGLGWAGGYVGSGVATANLAGRTLRDLVRHDAGRSGAGELAALPWVNHRVRKWEPEPLHWLGVRGMYATYREADRRERVGRGAASSRLARVADRVAGRG
ncbi:hypothetical protein YW7DRAFT_04492 [Streptomyces sp. AmelKG-E11A]|nr:hypothetical protein YW7DRAFT_04492 [Streptomyces sp. AmelKG-E11A]